MLCQQRGILSHSTRMLCLLRPFPGHLERMLCQAQSAQCKLPD